jgi:hypothetical protein
MVTFAQWYVYHTSCCTIIAKGEGPGHYKDMHWECAKCIALAFRIGHSSAVLENNEYKVIADAIVFSDKNKNKYFTDSNQQCSGDEELLCTLFGLILFSLS